MSLPRSGLCSLPNCSACRRMIPKSTVTSFVTGDTYSLKIKTSANCQAVEKYIFCIQCSRCQKQGVGFYKTAPSPTEIVFRAMRDFAHDDCVTNGRVSLVMLEEAHPTENEWQIAEWVLRLGCVHPYGFNGVEKWCRDEAHEDEYFDDFSDEEETT